MNDNNIDKCYEYPKSYENDLENLKFRNFDVYISLKNMMTNVTKMIDEIWIDVPSELRCNVPLDINQILTKNTINVWRATYFNELKNNNEYINYYYYFFDNVLFDMFIKKIKIIYDKKILSQDLWCEQKNILIKVSELLIQIEYMLNAFNMINIYEICKIKNDDANIVNAISKQWNWKNFYLSFYSI